ncbi:MAG: UDP-N-acetylmuramoyl-tripeptide--D-alanyl-D-alanine ligase [Armatimonadetes bacterium]|nr:UDP-N-acetylmuramoyl-tripeptide--D-alanyl-D-alanine ligase [Armatimonadota bacterium]
MRLRLSEIAGIMGVRPSGEDPIVTGIVVDSRDAGPGDLFCAIRGQSADGHDFVQSAAEAGAAAALVTRSVAAKIPVLTVESVAEALGRLAARIRDGFEGQVIGVTGSVGKTSTKELLAAALTSAGPVLKSEGNLNTEYGLPITWMRLERGHRFAVLEMAMRGPGQIRHLCNFSRPTVGVVTGLGSAHIGELGSRGGIANAKAELLEALPEDGVAILPAGRALDLLRGRARCRVLTFGDEESSEVRVVASRLDLTANRTYCEFSVGGERYDALIPGLGRHQAINAAGALAVCLAVGVETEGALRHMGGASLPTDRLCAVPFNRGTLLVDIYNSSPESCVEALRVLDESADEGRRIAVLGDMLELGDYTEEAHRLVGREVVRLELDVLLTIGDSARLIADEARQQGFSGSVHVLDRAEDAAPVLNSMRPGDIALIKGSRALRLERVLEQMGVTCA